MKDIITLYGNSGCGVCQYSKDKLYQNRISFRFIELKNLSHESKSLIYRAKGNDTALPLVFINGNYMGGPLVVDQIIQKYK